MSIDWLSFFAQIVNFAVLVWLLRVFLYDRIVKAMNDREAAINQRIFEAAKARQEAERQVELLRSQNLDLATRRDSLLAEAAVQAEGKRSALLEEARKEAEVARSAWSEVLRHERKALASRLKEEIGEEVFAIARKTLAELADRRLEGEIIAQFTKRFATIEPAQLELLADSVRASGGLVEVGTGFAPSPEEREEILHFLRENLDPGVKVRFAHEPNLICGVELRADSHRLSWNVATKIAGVEERFFEILDEGELDEAGGS